MGDSTTLNTAKPSFRFGPVYQDEFRTPEVRSLNATSKELWVALAFRTRSAKGGPEAISGMTVRYSDLAADLGKLNPKTGTVKPVAKKTIQRAMRELEARGLAHVTYQYRRPPRVVMLRPPTICGQCAAKDKSCLHRRSKIDPEFFKKLGFEFSIGLSTGGKTLSTQSGQHTVQSSVDSQGVHTIGSDPIHNSISKFEEKEAIEKERHQAQFDSMKKMLGERGIVLSSESTNKQIQDIFVKIVCNPRA